MYFNQLSKEVEVGQQAILRHLGVLEENGLIETYSEKSELGAPDRKYYRLSSSFSLTIALSEDDFTITSNKIEETRRNESMKYYNRFDSMPHDTGEALTSLQSCLTNIDEEISNLESLLLDLRALRQQILHRLHEIGSENFDGEERRVLYTIVKGSPKSLSELSDMLNEREPDLRPVLSGIKDKMKNKGEIHKLFKEIGS
jgi:ArsR family transcriptional regulator